MLEKLISFFKKLFGINDVKRLAAANIVLDEPNSFRESIIIVPNPRKEIAEKLQRDYQQGIIEEEDLNDDEYNLLSNLYQSQIDSIKQEIDNYKMKIKNLK